MCTPYANCGALSGRLLLVSATWWCKSFKVLPAMSRYSCMSAWTGERLVNWMKAAVDDSSYSEAGCRSE